jgi:hypothetical protein
MRISAFAVWAQNAAAEITLTTSNLRRTMQAPPSSGQIFCAAGAASATRKLRGFRPEAILEFIGRFEVKTVAMTDRIIGCPHEEGIDYEGPVCPHCPFWANRNRWTGEVIH